MNQPEGLSVVLFHEKASLGDLLPALEPLGTDQFIEVADGLRSFHCVSRLA